MEQIDRIARYVAAQGQAEVVRLADIAERAGRLLDDPEFIKDPSVKALVRPPPFPWEGAELFAVGAPATLFHAMIEDFATGEGLTVHYHVGLARSPNEMRRAIAARLGCTLADQARIMRSNKPAIAGSDLFVSPALANHLDRTVDRHRPAILHYSAQLHVNAS